MNVKFLFPLLFLLATATVGRVAAQCDSLGYRAAVYVSADGDSLPYRLLTPDTVVPGQRYPLVLFLHGAGERGRDNCAQLRHGAARFVDSTARRQFPAYVLFPQCPSDEFWPAILRQDHFGRGANPFPLSQPMSRPLRLADELLEHTITQFPIDTMRIYVVGLSMGGMGTLDLVSRRPQRFAAAVAICGGVNVHRLELLRGTRTRFRLIHGDADPVVPVRFSREAAAALRRAGASVEYIELPGVGHGSWYNAFRRTDFLEWLFEPKN